MFAQSWSRTGSRIGPQEKKIQESGTAQGSVPIECLHLQVPLLQVVWLLQVVRLLPQESWFVRGFIFLDSS